MSSGKRSIARTVQKYVLIFVGILAIGLYAVFFYITFNINHITDTEKFGQFGDSFGIITCLFTGLGIAGLLYNSWQVQEQLDKQQEEIDIAQAQAKREEFTATTFKLIDYYNNAYSNTKYSHPLGRQYAKDETDKYIGGDIIIQNQFQQLLSLTRSESAEYKGKPLIQLYDSDSGLPIRLKLKKSLFVANNALKVCIDYVLKNYPKSLENEQSAHKFCQDFIASQISSLHMAYLLTEAYIEPNGDIARILHPLFDREIEEGEEPFGDMEKELLEFNKGIDAAKNWRSKIVHK